MGVGKKKKPEFRKKIWAFCDLKNRVLGKKNLGFEKKKKKKGKMLLRKKIATKITNIINISQNKRLGSEVPYGPPYCTTMSS